MRATGILPFGRFVARALLLGSVMCGAVQAQGVLNVYSARHYPSDEALYAAFTQQTGIRIQRVDADDAGLVARLKAEGQQSPADVVLMVDASRLWRAEQDGLFAPMQDAVLQARVPRALQGQDQGQGPRWWGISTRARVVVYDPKRVKPEQVATYQGLADPALKGLLCTRSGAHPYNLSLFGAYLAHTNEARARDWLGGLVANMARPPRGGDTDQIRGVASGECGVALANSYYAARLMRSPRPADQQVMAKVALAFPSLQGQGTHLNVAGMAMAAHAPHPEAARAFMRYLVSDAAQRHLAEANNEWPVVPAVTFANPALQAMRAPAWQPDPLPVAQYAAQQALAQRLLDRAGYR